MDPRGEFHRARKPSGRRWAVEHCRKVGDSKALATLLQLLQDAKTDRHVTPTWIRKLLPEAREVAVRLLSFEPYYVARRQFWAYLEFNFFAGWEHWVPAPVIDIDQETSKIRAVLLGLCIRGFVSNDFARQSNLAYWLMKSPIDAVIEQLDELDSGVVREIAPGSPLYNLLKHSRCWRTYKCESLEIKYSPKIKERPRVANALVSIAHPDPGEIPELQRIPGKHEASFLKWRFRGISEFMQRDIREQEAYESRRRRFLAKVQRKPRTETLVPQAVAVLPTMKPSLVSSAERTHDYPDKIVSAIPKPMSRGPPAVQHQHGVQE